MAGKQQYSLDEVKELLSRMSGLTNDFDIRIKAFNIGDYPVIGLVGKDSGIELGLIKWNSNTKKYELR